MLGESGVLETAAGEDDLGVSVHLARRPCDLDRHFRKRVVEAGGDDRRIDSSDEVAHRGLDHRTRIDLPRRRPLADDYLIAALLLCVGGHVPQQRDFSLVTRVGLGQADRSEGVEVASDAVRLRRVEVALDHPADAAHREAIDGTEQRNRVQWRSSLERVVEQRQRDAPDVADRLIAAGQTNGPEGGEAGEAGEARDENLAAPRRAVGAIAGAVVRHTDDGPVESMLRHGARDVRVMVLHGNELDAFERLREACGEIVGMQVVRNDARRDTDEVLQLLDARLERAQGLERLEVTDVRPEERAMSRSDADGVLELRADGEHRLGKAVLQLHSSGGIPAGAAEHRRDPGDHAHDRVVRARLDPAVVHQEDVGDLAETLEGLVVVDGHRLVGRVAGGHHQRHARFAQEDVVQRRVRQEETDERILTRDLGGQSRLLPARDEHDRPLDGGQQRAVLIGELGDALGFAEVPDHDGERLRLAALAVAKTHDRHRRGGVAREMKPAQAFDGDGHRRAQRAGGEVDGEIGGDLPTLRIECDELRPAHGTGVRLRVKPPVQRVFVLPPAVGAHPEGGHGRLLAVVRDVADDRVARAAVRAVGEGVEEPAVLRIEDVVEAVVTRGQVRWNGDVPLLGRLAGDDGELARVLERDRLPRQLADLRGGRASRAEVGHEGIDRFVTAERVDDHARGVVVNTTLDAFACGELIDPRPETDALNDAANLDMTPDIAHHASR